MATPALPEREITAALTRVLASETFAAVARLCKFLQYVVEATLAGNQDQIKETVIAIDVYGRDTDFDPRTNPMVRVDASRLRRRLKEYYAEEGTADALRIELPKGTYVPRFISVEERREPAHFGHTQGPIPVPDASALPSIAITEFETLNGEDAYLGRGLTEEIKHHLQRFADLRIIASNAASRDEIMRLGAAAGADYHLSGSIQRSGKRVRVIAELQRLQTAERLWSERWERSLDPESLFELQDEIAERTVGNVASAYGAISRDRLQRSSALGPRELGSFEWTVRYYDYQRQETAELNYTLDEVFASIVASDPNYAQAWAILSHLALDRWRFGFDQNIGKAAALEIANSNAARALSIDPANTLAMTTQACVCGHEHDYSSFVDAANRILAVNPCDARAIGWVALNYAMFAQWEPALACAKRARRLNPLDVSTADLSEMLHALSRNDFTQAWQLMEAYHHVEVLWAQFFVMITAYKVGRAEFAAARLESLNTMIANLDLESELRKYPFPDETVGSLLETVEAIARPVA